MNFQGTPMAGLVRTSIVALVAEQLLQLPVRRAAECSFESRVIGWHRRPSTAQRLIERHHRGETIGPRLDD
jgi:hypothetical protein